jgi:hypothetical protein
MPNEISIANDHSVDDPAAEAHERKVEEELRAQYLELRREARGIFDAVKGGAAPTALPTGRRLSARPSWTTTTANS